MFSPTVRQMDLNTAVEPVKCTPPRSGCDSTCEVIIAGSPCTRLMTPGGRPASRSSSTKYQLLNIAEGEGLNTTVLPMSAGAVGRFPAIEVKLKGVAAYTKPSSAR